MNFPLLLLSLALGILIAGAAYLLHSLTRGGAVMAAVTVAGTLYFGGFPGFFVLLFSFLLISVVGRLTKKRRAPKEEGITEKSGARDAVQVSVNGAVGLIALIIGFVTEEPLFQLIFAAAIAEALSDSMASEVGVLSRTPPRDICTLRPVPPGKSGGVSPLGCLAACVGAALPTLLAACLFQGFSPLSFLLVFLSALFGVLADSLLGSLLQRKCRCTVCGSFTEKKQHCGERTALAGGLSFLNNDAVNLISNFLSAAFAALLLFLF